jgi:D-alanyl-D-alanine endopeptidase (penicillin-binding protein 7)
LKKSCLLLTLAAFLAGPMLSVPEAQAATHSKTKSHASKASAAKSKSRHKARSKAKNAVLQASQHRVKAARHARVAHYVETPLRAMRGVSANTLQGDELDLRAAAALVIDQKSGEALYAKNIDVPTSIASITKLMTAMVTLDAGLALDEEIVIGEQDVDQLKGTGSRLALGTRLTREELLHLALIASENRAAAALSRAFPGGRMAFVTAMNRKAQQLGMADTRFLDGTGLNSGNRATAADLAKMVDAAYRYPLIREITSTGSYDVSVPGKRMVLVKENGRVHKVSMPVQRHIAFNNTNSLTRDQEWEIGVSKTGFINEAGHCLVMQTKIRDQKVIIVLLDSIGKWGRIGDAKRIRKWLEHDSHVASHLNTRAST